MLIQNACATLLCSNCTIIGVHDTLDYFYLDYINLQTGRLCMLYHSRYWFFFLIRKSYDLQLPTIDWASILVFAYSNFLHHMCIYLCIYTRTTGDFSLPKFSFEEYSNENELYHRNYNFFLKDLTWKTSFLWKASHPGVGFTKIKRRALVSHSQTGYEK